MDNPSPQRPVALITGAGSGIGRATAHLLAGEGFSTVLVGRTRAPLEALAAELATPALVHPADVGQPVQLTGLVQATLDRFGRIDALVNNAGLAELHGIGQTDDQAIERLYRINAMGPAWLIAKVWPTMADQKSGCIVNVSTIGTNDPFPGFFGYACAKAATNLMALSCANEGRDLGIRAFAVAPGAVETPMLRGLFDTEALPPERCLTPQQVAQVIVDCVLGHREAENGRTIFLPNP